MNAVYIVIFAVAVLGAGAAALFRILAVRPDIAASASEWLADFSLESYAPMERLLDERDFRFLSQQPGYDVRIAKRLRLERKEVFKAYLQRLSRDFHHLVAITKLMLVYSGEDRTDLATSLWRQQVTFYLAVSALRVRLALYPMVVGTWDVQGVVGAVGQLQNQLKMLGNVPGPQPATS